MAASIVGPRRYLTLAILGTWDVLVVPHSDLAVGMDSGLPQETHHVTSVGLVLGFCPLLGPGLTSQLPIGK